MPTMRRPLAEYLVLRSCSFGNDFLHGSQKVPQKSTRTTLPRSDLSETAPLPPATAFTLKSGAGLPTRPDVELAVSDDLPPSSAAPHAETVRATQANARGSQGDVVFLMPALLPRVGLRLR